jgi:hypothetical protein
MFWNLGHGDTARKHVPTNEVYILLCYLMHVIFVTVVPDNDQNLFALGIVHISLGGLL